MMGNAKASGVERATSTDLAHFFYPHLTLSVKVRRHRLTNMKKKFTSLLLALLFALPALAHDFEYQGLWYTIIDEDIKTCEVSGYQSVNPELIIPSVVYDENESYSVISIGEKAFSQ